MIDMSSLAAVFSSSEDDGRIFGVTVAVVTNNQDPDNLGRVKVKFPWLSDEDESHWARVLTPMAGNNRGLYFLPEVDDEVLVAFEHGRPEFPFVLGALWNGRDKAPESNADGKNTIRTIKSRSGHTISFDDGEGTEKIRIVDKTGENSVVINSADNTIVVKAHADITIQADNGKLVLKGNGIEINSASTLKINADADLDLKSDGRMIIKGTTVNIN